MAQRLCYSSDGNTDLSSQIPGFNTTKVEFNKLHILPSKCSHGFCPTITVKTDHFPHGLDNTDLAHCNIQTEVLNTFQAPVFRRLIMRQNLGLVMDKVSLQACFSPSNSFIIPPVLNAHVNYHTEV